MKNIIKEYFNFSSNEKKGVFVLIIILLLLIIFPFLFNFFYKPEIPDYSKIDKLVSEIKYAEKDSLINNQYSNSDKEDFITKSETTHREITLFNFNPNNLPVEKWIELGLSTKQAEIIKKYEAKGGKFYKKEDLKKIYSIRPEQYALLEPYIQIPEEKPIYTYNQTFPKKDANIVIELNSADTVTLIQIKGIGISFAKRIIKYRDLLGGFIDKSQIKEVFGVDSLKFTEIEKNIIADPNKIKKLNINTITFDELKKHPYISYNIARALINYKQKHGAYKDVSDIKKCEIINDKLYNKIYNYICVK